MQLHSIAPSASSLSPTLRFLSSILRSRIYSFRWGKRQQFSPMSLDFPSNLSSIDFKMMQQQRVLRLIEECSKYHSFNSIHLLNILEKFCQQTAANDLNFFLCEYTTQSSLPNLVHNISPNGVLSTPRKSISIVKNHILITYL